MAGGKAKAKEAAAQATRDALARALETGALPADTRDTAKALLNRLDMPVRVAVMGLPGSGKSRVVDTMLGAPVIPDLPAGSRWPTLRLVHGDGSSTVTHADGRRETHPPGVSLIGLTKGAALIEMTRDLPSLKRLTLTEVTATLDPTAQHRAAAWAAAENDVAIWCTRAWEPLERDVWEKMPERLQVNAVLALTHRDRLRTPEGSFERLSESSGHLFDRIVMLDAARAALARHADGTTDTKLLRAAGGADLVQAVRRIIDRGRQAVLDQADVLLIRNGIDPAAAQTKAEPTKPAEDTSSDPVAAALARIGDAKPAAEPAGSDPVTEPATVAAPSKPDPSPVAASPEPAPAPDAEPAAEPEPIAEPAPKVATAPKAPPPPVPLTGAAREAIEVAAARLARVGSELAAEAEPDAAALTRRAVSEATWLADHLDEAADEAPELSPRANFAQDAADVVQLIRLEGEETGAGDALALLLQLRRALDDDLAVAA
ncbi:hypothetical protein [Jannaschia aquimarina]|uniref:Dynamin family protein n=1 Tax=Jannaschia aquimarina TaxID=935700 RepID=A0A0D1D5Q1_9RHOB|nr:hypothetical protein [Jannaschia aquimarina]KIT15278.1 hypothetical protein jaqu_29810 [Jannaschia aquimarina]SNT25475.1 hypothetical protein SAMN05421775_10921 [Jannaschia aquimarina]